MPTTKPVCGTRLIRGHPLTSGLVGCWAMNEGSGVSVYDNSGSGNHGTGINGFEWVSTPFGNGINFNGTYAQIDTLFNPSVSLGQQFTICTRLMMRSSRNYRGICGNHSFLSGVYRGIINGQWDSGLCFFGYGSSNRLYAGVSCEPPLNVWADIVAVYDCGNSVTVYIDSVPVVQGSTMGSINHLTTFYIGRAYSSEFLRALDGVVSSLMVYSRVLSPVEVAAWSNDPYQMFEPASDVHRYWYYPVTTGGGSIIGSSIIGSGIIGSKIIVPRGWS